MKNSTENRVGFISLAITILVLAGAQIWRNSAEATQLQRVIEDQAATQTYVQGLTAELSKLNGNVERTNGYLEALGLSLKR